MSRSAVVALGMSTIACGSTSDPVASDAAIPVADSATLDTYETMKPQPIYGSPPDSMVAAYGGSPTVGLGCMTNADCDRDGSGINICTKDAFSGDSLCPTSVCIGKTCDPGDGTKIVGCDWDRGLCLSGSSGGICLPACEFKDSTDKPIGCEGKNICNVYGWGKDAMTMSTIGVGYCFGGCVVDADCPTSNVCQTETRLCVKTKLSYSKTPGTACTNTDTKNCSCLFDTTNKGYCANVCTVGDGSCGAGFTCDASLPKTKIRDDDTVFTNVPTGIAGHCLKNCTTDADCAGLNAYCDERAGTAQKTCQIGKRRCVTNDQCPAGQTCAGATMTELGTCG